MASWSWQKSAWVATVSGMSLLISIAISLLTLLRPESRANLRSYISYSSGSYPENGIFNLLLYLSALFGVVLMTMRYVDIESRTLYRSSTIDHINKISLFFGLCSVAGMVIIASYPLSLDKEINRINEAGTYVLMVCGTVYCGIQTVLSYCFVKCSPCFITRLLLFAVAAAAVIATPTLLMQAERNSSPEVTAVPTNFTVFAFAYAPKELSLYIFSSAICLRILLLSFSIFQLSFVCEFKNVSGYIIISAQTKAASHLHQGSSWSTTHHSWKISERF